MTDTQIDSTKAVVAGERVSRMESAYYGRLLLSNRWSAYWSKWATAGETELARLLRGGGYFRIQRSCSCKVAQLTMSRR